MNYKENVAKKVQEGVREMEAKLITLVQELVVESFKNGVDAGKKGKSRKSRNGDKEASEEAETGTSESETS